MKRKLNAYVGGQNIPGIARAGGMLSFNKKLTLSKEKILTVTL